MQKCPRWPFIRPTVNGSKLRMATFQTIPNGENNSVNVLALDKHTKLSMVTSLSDLWLRDQRSNQTTTNGKRNTLAFDKCTNMSTVTCSCDPHLCYETDFLFAKSRGPQSYFRCTILNTQWTFCASMREKIKVSFLTFICVFRKYMFYAQLFGKWARWGRYYRYFEALKGLLLQKRSLIFPDFLQKMSRYYPRT